MPPQPPSYPQAFTAHPHGVSNLNDYAPSGNFQANSSSQIPPYEFNGHPAFNAPLIQLPSFGIPTMPNGVLNSTIEGQGLAWPTGYGLSGMPPTVGFIPISLGQENSGTCGTTRVFYCRGGRPNNGWAWRRGARNGNIGG